MAMMESKYYVGAYYDEAFRALSEAIATDDWDKVEDFIWENVQKGFNCLIIDHETGIKQYAFADDFDEEALNPEDLIREHKKNVLLEDLLLEQQEQM